MKSRTKTFEKECNPGDIIDFVIDQIEATDEEVITNTPPSYDVVSKTNHKYRVTITKVNKSEKGLTIDRDTLKN